MSDFIVCGQCALKHRPRPDGCCPRCKRPAAVASGPDEPATELPNVYDGRAWRQPADAGDRPRSGSGVLWLGAMVLVIAGVGGVAYWMNQRLPDATVPLGGVPKLKAGSAALPSDMWVPPVATQTPIPEFFRPSVDPNHQAPITNPAWLDQEQRRIDASNASQQRALQRLLREGDCGRASSNLAAISLVDRDPKLFELREHGKAVTEEQKAEAKAESEKYLRENCR